MEKDFLDLINQNKQLLLKVCHIYCDQTEDRKDLFQEIILQLWKSFPNFKGQAQITTWMYRVALNTAITHFKKKSRLLPTNPLIANWDPPELLENDEYSEQLHGLYFAINTLDKIEKSIIFLYLEENSYDIISEVTGLSKTNVGVRLNRIKLKLANILNTI